MIVLVAFGLVALLLVLGLSSVLQADKLQAVVAVVVALIGLLGVAIQHSRSKS